MIVKTAYDLVPYLDAIERVKASSLLNKDQRSQILQEMDKSFIDIVFCQQCPQTHAVIKSIIGGVNGSTQKPTPKVAKKGTKVSKKSSAKREQLLHKTNANGGRQSTPEKVVNEKT